LVLALAGSVRAQVWESLQDIPPGACKGMRLADCYLMVKDLGVPDDLCYDHSKREALSSRTIEQCLEVRAQMREIKRQHYQGTLPPEPYDPEREAKSEEAKDLIEKHTGWRPVGPRTETRCIPGPVRGGICFGLLNPDIIIDN